MFSREVGTADREQAWMRLEVLGQPLLEKFAWAVPDAQALKICAAFGPLVDMGCGKGYWAKLLRAQGVDVLALDKYEVAAPAAPASSKKKSKDKHTHTHKKPEQQEQQEGHWVAVQHGSPASLDTSRGQNPQVAGRSLLLSYPDQGEAMAIECLQHYDGEVILHIGELLVTGTGTRKGGLQAPWGGTTSSDFQVALAEEFHCVLQYRLPAFPFAHDFLTVWKRTQWTSGRGGRDGSEGEGESESESEEQEEALDPAMYPGDDEGPGGGARRGGESDEGSEGSEGSEDSDEDCWADIPDEERLPCPNVAAPMLAHLLR